MRELLAVVTAPREVDYLPETLACLDGWAGGWRGRKLVIWDRPFTGVAPAGWEYHRADVMGARLGSVRTFGRLMALVGDIDRLLVVHDDARLCLRALEYIQGLELPGHLAAAMFYQEGGAGLRWGLHQRTFRGDTSFIGAICALYSRRAVDRLKAYDWDGWPMKSGLDCAISRALQGEQFAVHVPHLAQHVGDAPAIERVIPQGGRRSTSFFEHFNAQVLRPPEIVTVEMQEARGLVLTSPGLRIFRS